MNPDGTVRLLIVDDDDTMRLICRRFFARVKDAGELVVEEAASGDEAIELLRDHHFDCVLADYRMGATSGIDVLAFALQERPDAIRILFTGFAAPAIREDATEQAKVHEFLEKPMTTPELETMLRDKVVESHLKPLAQREEDVRP